ncbi:glutathione peroxidase [Devosia sp. CAU 1758]
MPRTLSAFSANRLDGTPQSLGEFAGHVVLVVNVASHCGFTQQYEGLETLYQTYRERGLVVLGFPCNQFGEQEPGTADEIASFCATNYGVSFPMFERIDVNGDAAHPLFEWLRESALGPPGSEAIQWNFTKFLIDRDGAVVARYAPTTEPADIRSDIEPLL